MQWAPGVPDATASAHTRHALVQGDCRGTLAKCQYRLMHVQHGCPASPARPFTKRRPPVAPYRHVFPTREDSPGLKAALGGGTMTTCPPAMPLPT